jgi:DNA polymerase-3 subunit beta
MVFHLFTQPITITIKYINIKGNKMKLKFTKSIIENNLAIAINFIEKKDNSQITSHLLINAKEYLSIKATDKEFGIELKDKSTEILEKGKATINGKKFYEIIKALNDDFIHLEIENNIATITQNSSVYKLPVFDANEFPEFPIIEDAKEIIIDPFIFIDGLKKILPVIDTNNPKYELNGALLNINDKTIDLVSTDTKRLAIVLTQNRNSKEIELIIPRKAISEIRKLFINDFKLFFDGINLIIKSENIKFFTKLINGKFPNYQRIIPSSYKTIIKLNKSEFIKKIKQITVISNEVKVIINNNILEFNSISEETFEAKTQMNIESDLENFIFAANSRFILDFLSVIDNEIFELCLNDANIPFTLRDGDFQTIIMPLSI